MAPAFARSADFALDKPAGVPCPNLREDLRCGIHDLLRPKGFPGCDVYDCFGAGQRLVQQADADWRTDPTAAQTLFAALPVVRQLHELVWLLVEAEERGDAATTPQARALRDEVEHLAAGPLADDVAEARARVGALLARVSEQVRRPAGPDRRGADLVGADLRGADLRGASLRGALLLGATLARADQRTADLLGADLRGADLSGADLTGALFLARPQLKAARGDGTTLLPDWLERPRHWT